MNIRNIAIIAHVDHGKTTMVDTLFQQTGTFKSHEAVVERVMDSLDLEKERGITIAAKNASIVYNNIHVNIVDTPGHADFGGEVERTLMMVDGAILLVDAAEGCLPQTRYVLQKALGLDLKIIVCINKIDRPDARIEEVLGEINDLFLDLVIKDEQLDFPVMYASGRKGFATTAPNIPSENMSPLLDKVISYIPAPRVQTDGPVQMLINNLIYNPFLGMQAVGKVQRGTLRENQQVVMCTPGQPTGKMFKVTKISKYVGLKPQEVPSVSAGEITMIAGFPDFQIGHTICEVDKVDPLPQISVDPPTVAINVSVNTSPLAGKEGTYMTSRKLFERLQKETLYNVALKLENTDSAEVFLLKGRGELQLSIVIENIRREGFEMMVSRPTVLTREIDGVESEPIELVVVDVPEKYSGAVTEKLSMRKGQLINMTSFDNGRVRQEFLIPTRRLIGYRSTFLTDTRGEGLMSSYIKEYRPAEKASLTRKNGALICDRDGETIPYGLWYLEERGKLLVGPNEPCYEGMVIGECARENDMNVNPTKEKKLTNIRAAGKDEAVKLIPIQPMTLERALEWIDDDEWVEITPKRVRIRKKILKQNERGIVRN